MPLKLTKRGDTYHMQGTVAGQRIRESTGARRRAQAIEIARAREQEIIDRATLGRRATVTFAEAALAYMDAGGEARFLDPILAALGPDFLLADLHNDTLGDLARAIYPTAAPATVQRQLVAPCSAVYNAAAANGLADPRKFQNRGADNKRLRWLTPAEAEALLAAADPHALPILAALLGSGARVSEILAVEARHFHVETGEIWVPDTKNGHPRMIELAPRALRLVLASNPPEAGRVFLTPKGRPYIIGDNRGGQIKGAMDKAAAAAGLEGITPHVLRHTWATWYYAATHDFGGLLDKGGWRKSDMANRYRKAAPRTLARDLLAAGWDFRGQSGIVPQAAPEAPTWRPGLRQIDGGAA